MAESHEVPQFTLSYLADFDLKVSDTLLNQLLESIWSHLEANRYDSKDLTYLLLALNALNCQQSLLVEEVEKRLKTAEMASD